MLTGWCSVLIQVFAGVALGEVVDAYAPRSSGDRAAGSRAKTRRRRRRNRKSKLLTYQPISALLVTYLTLHGS